MTFLTIVASFLLSSCLFFFNPLFVYFSDPKRLGDLTLSYVLQSLLVTVGVAAALALPRLKLGKYYTMVLCFLGTTVFLYSYAVQINFGLFRGNKFGNEELLFQTAERARFLEPAALVALLLIVGVVFRYARPFFTVFFCFLFLSLGYELGTQGRDYLASLPENAGTGETQLELQEIFHFSRTEPNILFFIPDAGAGYVIPELMQEDDRASRFDGFVFYANTVSVGSYTMPSTAALIGGERFFPDRINERNDRTILEHITDAYNWLATTLDQNGYESTFISPTFTRCVDIRDATTCSWTKRFKKSLEDEYGFEAIEILDRKAIRYFATFKTLPFLLKPRLYRSAGWEGALEGYAQLATSVNKRYHDYLMLRALPRMSAAEDDLPSQFGFLWNQELIAPFNVDAQCQPLSVGREDMYSHATRINATRCLLDALGDWIQWMKDNGVYDNTKIIVAADHGAGNYGGEWYKQAVNSLLMVKDFDRRGPLETSDLLMQNSDVAALICSALEQCDGVGPDPTQVPIPDRVAKYFYTTHGNYAFAKESRRFDIKKVFEIRGDVRDHPEFKLE